MKAYALASVFVLPLSASACGFITGLFTTKEVSIDYVGHIELGKPLVHNGYTSIPVIFSGGQWLQNSAIGFKKIKSVVDGAAINITVETCLVSNASQQSNKQITVKSLASGEYNVTYINPDGSSKYIGKVKM